MVETFRKRSEKGGIPPHLVQREEAIVEVKRDVFQPARPDGPCKLLEPQDKAAKDTLAALVSLKAEHEKLFDQLKEGALALGVALAGSLKRFLHEAFISLRGRFCLRANVGAIDGKAGDHLCNGLC